MMHGPFVAAYLALALFLTPAAVRASRSQLSASSKLCDHGNRPARLGRLGLADSLRDTRGGARRLKVKCAHATDAACAHVRILSPQNSANQRKPAGANQSKLSLTIMAINKRGILDKRAFRLIHLIAPDTSSMCAVYQAIVGSIVERRPKLGGVPSASSSSSSAENSRRKKSMTVGGQGRYTEMASARYERSKPKSRASTIVCTVLSE